MSTLNTAIQEMINRLAAGLQAGNLSSEDQLLISKALSALQDNGQWEQALIAVAEYHLNEGVGAMNSATGSLTTAKQELDASIVQLLAEARRINENYIVPAADAELVAGRKHFLPLDRVVKIPANTQSGDVFHIRVCRVRTGVGAALKFPPIHPNEDKVLHRFMATGNKVFVPAGLFANFYGAKVAGNRNINVLCDMAITNVEGTLIARYLSDEDETEQDVEPVVASRNLPAQIVTASGPVTPPDGATMAIVTLVGGGASRAVNYHVPYSEASPAGAVVGACVPLADTCPISVSVGIGAAAATFSAAVGNGGSSCFCNAVAPGGIANFHPSGTLPAAASPYPTEYLTPALNRSAAWTGYLSRIAEDEDLGPRSFVTGVGGTSAGTAVPVRYIGVDALPCSVLDPVCAGEAFGREVGFSAPRLVPACSCQSGAMLAAGAALYQHCVSTSNKIDTFLPCVGACITAIANATGSQWACCSETPVPPNGCQSAQFGSVYGQSEYCCYVSPMFCINGPIPQKKGAPGNTADLMGAACPCAACPVCPTAAYAVYPGNDGIVEITWL
ncbi:hypothetical protein H10PHJ05_49 [Aeromonas phage HJ05]|nr:hypothetical protein H10PHJ05_49 [Aeromonas phage HJ05]